MIANMRIEFKIIAFFVAFTLFIVLFERYQISENVIRQYKEAKISKNELLIDTITPIVTLNISLGLNDANSEYLDQIARQNADIRRIVVFDAAGKRIHSFVKSAEVAESLRNCLNFSTAELVDALTGERLGSVDIDFFDDDYHAMIASNNQMMINVFGAVFVMLVLFVMLIKREFRGLRALSDEVLKYDPKRNNFGMEPSGRSDEIGVVRDAIVTMVERIDEYAEQMAELNASLEEKVQERTRMLEEANMRLERLSMTDELTQLPNRRHFVQYFEKVWGWAVRERKPLSVIMCDIDHFKQVNDTYGHAAGDLVLENVAMVIKGMLKRKTDFAARFGGEEFAIVLYDVGPEDARELCETIRRAVECLEGLEYHGSYLRPVTLSFGVCTRVPTTDDMPFALLKSADEALYRAKHEGRNRTVSDCEA